MARKAKMQSGKKPIMGKKRGGFDKTICYGSGKQARKRGRK